MDKVVRVHLSLDDLICTTREVKDGWMEQFRKYPKAAYPADVFCADCEPAWRVEMKAAGQCLRPVDWKPPEAAR